MEFRYQDLKEKLLEVATSIATSLAADGIYMELEEFKEASPPYIQISYVGEKTAWVEFVPTLGVIRIVFLEEAEEPVFDYSYSLSRPMLETQEEVLARLQNYLL